MTRRWWNEERHKYDVYISEETITELGQGNYPQKQKMSDFIKNIEKLQQSDEIGKIVEVYIKNTLMPQKAEGDAVHLAYASFYNIDFLLTWNCNHLANANKLKHIRIINATLNLFTPDIITPLELFMER